MSILKRFQKISTDRCHVKTVRFEDEEFKLPPLQPLPIVDSTPPWTVERQQRVQAWFETHELQAALQQLSIRPADPDTLRIFFTTKQQGQEMVDFL